MLNSAKALRDYRLDGLDGEIGKVREFCFDDRHWTIRYLVANTGYWLPGRQVLISPYALVAIDRDIYNLKININLTKQQIQESPSLDSDKPVSRQFEGSYYGYYGYPIYWGGPYRWGAYPYIERIREQWHASTLRENNGDPHLRSTHAVTGYHIQAQDGEIGQVLDFIIDDETWTIRYLIVNTHNWWPGKKVLVSPQWIESVSWEEQSVRVKLSREAIKHSPRYDEEFLLTRDYEAALHRHYNRDGYWVDGLPAQGFPSAGEGKFQLKI